MLHKYPKTPHLPWSKSINGDDVLLGNTHAFAAQEVVILEKMDGENTSMYPNHMHARSTTPRPHDSRDLVKGLHGGIKHLIPHGWRLVGENMYAKHSIHYTHLEGYFYLFSVWDDQNYNLGWDDVLLWAQRLGFPTPPQLYRGLWNPEAIANIKLDTTTQEGYVVRTVEGFAYADFADHMAKWVRPKHVQTSQHWMNEMIVPNLLKLEE